VFIAETRGNRVRVLRAKPGAGAPTISEVFASGLDRPFGIAFHPAGAKPQWVYVANNNSIVRFAYKLGDLKARGSAQVIVPRITRTAGGHATRDLAFTSDGQRLLVSVGSESNVADRVPPKSVAEAQAWEANHGLGTSWGTETNRATVLAFDPETGGEPRVFASGIRNCAGMTVQPATGALWCAVNERDGLGDDLVPDYATRVREGHFYGWPWYYLGAHEDPRHAGERPDLALRITAPDVLFQAHSAALGIVFYPLTPSRATSPAAFPAEYRGDAFVVLHGSWNRNVRTGYKVVRLFMKDGVPTGAYQDFATGFVVDDDAVWGRPSGVAVAADGALLVADDGGDVVWRIAPADRNLR
jgi:glucose/arabinose dehydrogenase